jgi:nucleoid DNA-binding protein
MAAPQYNAVTSKLANKVFEDLPAEIKAKLTKVTHHLICNSFMESILRDIVATGEKVNFPNRFCIKRVERKARDHVNFRHKGDTVHVPAHYVLKFEVMKKLKDELKDIEITSDVDESEAEVPEPEPEHKGKGKGKKSPTASNGKKAPPPPPESDDEAFSDAESDDEKETPPPIPTKAVKAAKKGK